MSRTRCGRAPALILTAALAVTTSATALAVTTSAAAGTLDRPVTVRDRTPDGAFAALEGHLSFFTDEKERSIVANTFGYALRLGYRWGGHGWGAWGVFLHIEHNLWLAFEYETSVENGVVNLGVGAEIVYAHGLVRSSVALGPSILAFDTLIDERGEVGVFLDARPLGLRWAFGDHLALGLDPIGVALVAPVLSGIPLVQVEYRTLLYVEGLL